MEKKDYELMKYAGEASKVNDMLNNLIRQIQSDAYKRGYTDRCGELDEAYDRGYNDRGGELDEAYDRGYTDGQEASGANSAAYESGYNIGFADAEYRFNSGDDTYKDGYDEGYLRGYADALEMVSNLKK